MATSQKEKQMTTATAVVPETDPVRAQIPERHGPSPSVLICITDSTLRGALTETLLLEGFPTSMVKTPTDVKEKVESDTPDCVIFDVAHGALEAIREVRSIGMRVDAVKPTGVLVITPPAAQGHAKRVKDMADEFVLTPFTIEEIRDRIDSAAERGMQSNEDTMVVTDPRSGSKITIDRSTRSVRVDDRELTFSNLEFDLLVALARDPMRMMRKEALMKEVWGWDGGNSRTLEAHISRVRRRLDPENTDRWVHCTRGYGYALCRRN